MERSFKAEVESLRLGDGEIFHGEGILAVTKALLQSGVSYVGGYQGAPVSHLIDVLVDAKPLLDELGVHLETSTSEAAAAAMLGASINYPLRGAATWKATVGTNVASDALSNLASAGVKGGTLIVIGEDYGEGASIIQERSHAFAMKSQMWLLDPRPNLPTIVNMVERGFELSEESNTPVMLELRIRACHVYGRFPTKANRRPQFSRRDVIEKPDFDFSRICLPPATYAQEKHKIEHRLPAAIKFVREHKLNEVFAGDANDVGIVMQGGLYNTVVRALHQLGLADAFGNSRIPLYVLNVTYPLVPDEVATFCAGKKAVLMVEEGQPDYLEQALHVILRRADLQTKVHGKDVLPMAGEYTSETVLRGLVKFLEQVAPRGVDVARAKARIEVIDGHKAKAMSLLGAPVPPRPPSFCTGCPERPIFSALKIVEREMGPTHISADIGCHTFSTLPPFNLGNTVLGYGMGLASSVGVAPNFKKRVISIMGDGGFWHNGLTNGVASANFNQDDGVLVIMKNGYSSATGWQWLPSSLQSRAGGPSGMTIENALKGVGVRWMKAVYNYNVGKVTRVLKDAMTTAERGLKVIIAEGECMLAKQRRVRAEDSKKIQAGQRVAKPKFGVDDQVCTGDHSCIRLSGCPSLTVKDNPDRLRRDPVATVIESCVGCGNCGEVSHAAILCPSFYKTELVYNPGALERLVDRVRRRVIAWLATPEAAPTPSVPGEARIAAAAE
ncbi:MAG TPA: indolepyruvate ferredoxin oxidoreductase subunit alpha [Alphaproteobacteria bacterium]|nr:indolepyruvate ferredoxin oxidoreductase subunit alpha [Alphaproteobacteria bacterium]